ncbi:MAG TPA: SDR family oxidoreductase [Casimicrobiaceae bacterium]
MSFEELAGKACLVTGASRGIGAAVARGLGGCKAKVAVHYRTGRSQAQEVAADIERAGGVAHLVAADIAERDALDRLVDSTVQAFGRLDILIHNAGDQISRVNIGAFPDDLFERHVAVNIRPTFAACRAAVRQFRRQGGGGTIVNVSSIAARTGGGGGSAVYAGAKAFMSTFSRSLAKELAKENIRINVVSPGVIATGMQDRVTSPEQLRATATQIPMARVGEPDECVGTFLYLCSDRLSGYVTGQVVEVNGGLLMP